MNEQQDATPTTTTTAPAATKTPRVPSVHPTMAEATAHATGKGERAFHIKRKNQEWFLSAPSPTQAIVDLFHHQEAKIVTSTKKKPDAVSSLKAKYDAMTPEEREALKALLGS